MRVAMTLGGVIVLAAVAAAPADEPARCTFTNRPMQPGDTVTQQVEFTMSVEGTLTQRGKRQSTNYESVQSQRRRLELLPHDAGTSPLTKVTFEQAERALFRADAKTITQTEPVDGKSYLLRRHGERLEITDSAGNPPPEEERAFVTSAMEGVGRVNPFSEFLDRRTCQVGESIRLPNKITSTLFAAWRDAIPHTDVDLKLVAIDREHLPATAVFSTSVRGHTSQADPGSTRLDGQLTVEIDTCRVRAVELVGPVHTNEVQRTPAGENELDCQGTIAVVLRTLDQGELE